MHNMWEMLWKLFGFNSALMRSPALTTGTEGHEWGSSALPSSFAKVVAKRWWGPTCALSWGSGGTHLCWAVGENGVTCGLQTCFIGCFAHTPTERLLLAEEQKIWRFILKIQVLIGFDLHRLRRKTLEFCLLKHTNGDIRSDSLWSLSITLFANQS